jgi:hypothetical protein
MSAIQLAEFLDRDELGRNRLALAALTENPNATPEMLDRVARLPVPKMEDPVGSWLPVMGKNKKGLSVARLIAMDERAKPETLDFLAQSRAEDVRGAVASNPKTPGPALLSIAQKGGSYADWGLAANPNTPSDILRRIADAGDEYARSSVARNKGAPPDLLVKLAADPVWHVRRDAASNKNLPLDAAQHLAQDPDERVSGVAAWRLKR